jgi:hypothetical protein
MCTPESDSSVVSGEGGPVEGCVVANEAALLMTSQLLQLRDVSTPGSVLSRILTSKSISVSGSQILSPLTVDQAERVRTIACRVLTLMRWLSQARTPQARDTLAKALYGRLFDRLIAVINKSLSLSQSTSGRQVAHVISLVRGWPFEPHCGDHVAVLCIFRLSSLILVEWTQ